MERGTERGDDGILLINVPHAHFSSHPPPPCLSTALPPSLPLPLRRGGQR